MVNPTEIWQHFVSDTNQKDPIFFWDSFTLRRFNTRSNYSKPAYLMENLSYAISIVPSTPTCTDRDNWWKELNTASRTLQPNLKMTNLTSCPVVISCEDRYKVFPQRWLISLVKTWLTALRGVIQNRPQSREVFKLLYWQQEQNTVVHGFLEQKSPFSLIL